MDPLPPAALAPPQGRNHHVRDDDDDPFVGPAPVSPAASRHDPDDASSHRQCNSDSVHRAAAAAETITKPNPARKPVTSKPGEVPSPAEPDRDHDLVAPSYSASHEKVSLRDERGRESKSPDSKPRRNRDTSNDPDNRSRKESHHPSSDGGVSNISYADDDDDDDDDEHKALHEEKAVPILLFMSGPCLLVSLIGAFWTCFALTLAVLSSPLRLCCTRPTFGEQLAGLLGPILNLQLRYIYTPSPSKESSAYRVRPLVAVLLLSPFVSFIVMFAAWTLAVYWISSTIVGDPAGQDRRDDGKETVLALRSWWERWLVKGVKDFW